MKDNNQNRGKGYHVTIVDNNTGETVTDADTRGILYAMLHETEEGLRVAAEHEGDFKIGVVCGRHLDKINPVEMFSLIGRLQWIIQTEMEENPILQMIQMITDENAIQIGEDEEGE
ncbi:MAG: hypothetical protein IIX85_08245 [Clostridia bacterium]|nr:hypothetical protein [Clostridia bacterium]MBQ5662779.1 hypothetical protein [Clostridia bacterium]